MSNADPIKLKKKFPGLGLGDIQSLIDQFSAVDISGYGSISENEALKLCQQVSGNTTYDQIRNTIKECETNANGTIEIEEFFEIVQKLKSGTAKGVSSTTNAFNQKVITVKGSNQDTAHSINEDEKYEFATHINQALVGDPDLGDRLPIDPNSMQLFDECKDGLVLSKLINTAAADTIDERVLNVGTRLNTFKMTENNNLLINSAKAIGCSVVNIGSKDLIEGREHLILGLIWQIIKIGLLAKIDIKYHPELYRLLEDGETLEDFLKLPAEHILLRWFNYHLKNAGWDRRVTNFSKDVKDGQNYTVLLNQLSPSQCSLAPLKENDLYQRAEMVLQNADTLGCRKYLSPKTLVGGNPKLNLAFVAHLFNTHPCLEPLTEQEAVDLIVDEGDDREARAFTLWLNSLNVDPYVNNLYSDVKDGIVLLQAMDHVSPGIVNWRSVNKPKAGVQTKPLEELEDGEEEEYIPYFARGGISRFKQIENTNYLTELGKQLNFSLVGIQGADITDGQKTLILGLVWQLMRAHVVSTLKSLGSGGRDITDTQMVKWANEKVAKSGKSSKINNFRDPNLRSARYLLDLLDGMRSGIVDYSLVNDARTDEDAKQNALYAISIARKMNATIFLLPEDIVEVKPKMILTFIGSLMAIDNAAN